MEEKTLLKGLKEGKEDVLAAIIDQYTAYVATVIRNQLGAEAQVTEIEELASTVFFTLWQKRHTILTTHLRGWLGVVARNCARSYLRKQKREGNMVSLEELIVVSGDRAEELLEAKERSRILNLALLELGEPDSEILKRYYYKEEKISSIAQHLEMNPEAVKSRLRRGRAKLKEILQREGYEE